MATVLLNYDENNPLALPTLNYLKKVGFIKAKPHKTGLDKALEDISKGKVYHLCRRAKVWNQTKTTLAKCVRDVSFSL